MSFFKISANGAFPSPPNPQPISAGQVMETCAEFTVPNGQANGSVVQMIPLPARARVIETIVAASGSTTLVVGDGDDPDRYITTGAVTTPVRSNAATAFGYNYGDAGDTIDITFGATPTQGVVIRLTALYVYE